MLRAHCGVCCARPNAVVECVGALGTEREAVRTSLGGRVFDPITGGSHTSTEVLQFLSETLVPRTTTGADQSSRVKNAYGASEFPGISVNGEIGEGVDLELVDVPEMGFLTSDKPYPRGEIRVRHKGGSKPLATYWNNPVESAKVFKVSPLHHPGTTGPFVYAALDYALV